MGLFDIFKRKSKKSKKNNKNQKVEKNNQENQLKSNYNQSQNVTSTHDQPSSLKSNRDDLDHKNITKSDEKTNDFKLHDQSHNDHKDDSKENHQYQNQISHHPKTQKIDDEKLYEHGLAKSRSSFGQKLNALFAHFRSVDDQFFDDLEDTLIESDVGVDMAVKLTDQLRDEVKLRNAKSKTDVQNVIIKKLIDLYDHNGNDNNTINFAKHGPTVILFVGVNGAGKTTTIGKMAHMYKQQGKKVLLAAADTFRAGAIEQLDAWALKDNVDIVKKEEGSDPSSVVYDAVSKAKHENYDILFVDTAGRLQNKVNLMNELIKMKKVLTRSIPDAPNEVLLVLDATTGQNALSQAKLFSKDTNVSGIVLTKLDGTAKGGIILAIRNEMHLPVKYVGLGEGVNDLRPFDANEFIYGLFKGLFKQ